MSPRNAHPSPLPPNVTTFPQLIRWIADEYHDGAVWRIAPQIRVSVPLVNHWVHGVVRSPQTTNLIALADRYGLDFTEIVRLLPVRPISGGSDGIATRALAAARDTLPLIGRSLRALRRWACSGPRLALA